MPRSHVAVLVRSSPYIHEGGPDARARSASESSGDLLEEPPEPPEEDEPPPPPPEDLPPPPELPPEPDSLPESEPEYPAAPLKPTSTPLYAHVVGKEFQLSSEESLNEELLRLRGDDICPAVGQTELPSVGTSPAERSPVLSARSLHVQEFPVVGTSPSPDGLDQDRDDCLLRPAASATSRRVSLQVSAAGSNAPHSSFCSLAP